MPQSERWAGTRPRARSSEQAIVVARKGGPRGSQLRANGSSSLSAESPQMRFRYNAMIGNAEAAIAWLSRRPPVRRGRFLRPAGHRDRGAEVRSAGSSPPATNQERGEDCRRSNLPDAGAAVGAVHGRPKERRADRQAERPQQPTVMYMFKKKFSSCMDARKVLTEINENEFGVVHRKWGTL